MQIQLTPELTPTVCGRSWNEIAIGRTKCVALTQRKIWCNSVTGLNWQPVLGELLCDVVQQFTREMENNPAMAVSPRFKRTISWRAVLFWGSLISSWFPKKLWERIGDALQIRDLIALWPDVLKVPMPALQVMLFVLGLAGLALIAFWPEIKQPQKKAQTPEPSGGSPSPPLIVPDRYGQGPPGKFHGLTVVNDGETAFQVSIPEVKMGKNTVTFQGNVTRLAKGAEAFFEVWLQITPGHTSTGSALYRSMQAENLEHFDIAIIYKDAATQWWKSKCKIEINLESPNGLDLIFQGQEPIPPPATAAPPLRFTSVECHTKNSALNDSPAVLMRVRLVWTEKDPITLVDTRLRITLPDSTAHNGVLDKDLTNWYLAKETTTGYHYATLGDTLWNELASPLIKGILKEGWVAFVFPELDTDAMNAVESMEFEIEDALGAEYKFQLRKPWSTGGIVADRPRHDL